MSMLSPIAEPLGHPQVTDIVVNEPCHVLIRKAGAWERMDIQPFDFDTLDAATILIGQRAGREFDEGSCYVNSTLPDGQRFQGVRPPGTKNGRLLWAIRRPPTTARRIDDPDFLDLFESTNAGVSRRQRMKGGMLSLWKARDWLRFFPAVRLAGMNIGICGATGSGKTDLARRLLQIYRQDIRIVTIETDDEFGDVGPFNKAPLFYDDTRISSDEAVRIALRLCPTEIAHQEVRGPEAYSLLRALESGHCGLTTWHAEEGREFDALSMMARQHPAGREIPDDKLTGLMRSLFDVLVYTERSDNGFRISSVRLMAAEEVA